MLQPVDMPVPSTHRRIKGGLMTDRYDEGYERAKRYYKRQFNLRHGLFAEVKTEWHREQHVRSQQAIRKLWPDLAAYLDQISKEADAMDREPR